MQAPKEPAIDVQPRVRLVCSFERHQGRPGIALSCRFTTLLDD